VTYLLRYNKLVANRRYEPIPPPFGAPVGVDPLELRLAIWQQKARVPGLWYLRDRKFSRFDTISTFPSIQLGSSQYHISLITSILTISHLSFSPVQTLTVHFWLCLTCLSFTTDHTHRAIGNRKQSLIVSIVSKKSYCS